VPPTIVPPRAVAAGPLAARWLWYELPPLRAGATVHGRAELENAGTASWIPGREEQISVSYHWLDPLGNPIVWAGIFSPVQRPVAPRLERRALVASVRGAGPLLERTLEALYAQEEPLREAEDAEVVAHLVAGCLPLPDWSRRVLDAHADGFAAVGGSIEPAVGPVARRRTATVLAPWTPGGGRKPAFEHPLLCPSVVVEHEPAWSEDVAGLPALAAPPDPWLYDGRIRMRVLTEALRP
jgi:hypothetical protein